MNDSYSVLHAKILAGYVFRFRIYLKLSEFENVPIFFILNKRISHILSEGHGGAVC